MFLLYHLLNKYLVKVVSKKVRTNSDKKVDKVLFEKERKYMKLIDC